MVFFFKYRQKKCLVLLGLWIVLFIISIRMNITVGNTCPNVCNETDVATGINISEHNKTRDIEDDKSWGPHKMAVVIPFRDRIEALMEFAPFMHNYLNKRKTRHTFYVINQGDNLRFNRGALINVGYLESRAECDHICMHDVDTIPDNPDITYPYPERGPFHVSSPDIHPRNHYKSFVGGILIIRNEHFKYLNGFSNRYWGWGAEDDDFGIRMRTKGLKIYKHMGIKTGNLTFRHIHDDRLRPRDDIRYFTQNKQKPRDQTGLQTLKYDVLGRYEIKIGDTPVKIINVKLPCNLGDTPWCVKPEEHKKYIDQGLITTLKSAGGVKKAGN